MKIDNVEALRALEKAVEEADSAPDDWVEVIQTLARACTHTNRTFIAALGTAILAKCVEPTVDVYSLKVKRADKSTNGYSARSLCKNVLAANAPRLGIDLGVRGREPLNNQPFFAEEKISEKLPVEREGQEPLRQLLAALKRLSGTTKSEARRALSAFMKARRVVPAIRLSGDTIASDLSENALLEIIKTFVSEKSESGKRAQAVAAGLLDIEYGAPQVEVGKIHDPSRHYPGDVAIRTRTTSLEDSPLHASTKSHPELKSETPYQLSVEVRDKSISIHDLYHFVNKAITQRVDHVVMLAVATQKSFDPTEAIQWAQTHGIKLDVVFGWQDFTRRTLFRSPALVTAGHAYRAIYERLIELEISEAGIALWESHTKGEK